MTDLGDLTARQLDAIRRNRLRAWIDLHTDDGPVRVRLHSVDVATMKAGGMWVVYRQGARVDRASVAISTSVEVEEQTTNRTRGTT